MLTALHWYAGTPLKLRSRRSVVRLKSFRAPSISRNSSTSLPFPRPVHYHRRLSHSSFRLLPNSPFVPLSKFDQELPPLSHSHFPRLLRSHLLLPHSNPTRSINPSSPPCKRSSTPTPIPPLRHLRPPPDSPTAFQARRARHDGGTPSRCTLRMSTLGWRSALGA